MTRRGLSDKAAFELNADMAVYPGRAKLEMFMMSAYPPTAVELMHRGER